MTLSITPVSIWKQGAALNATKINARVIQDDLNSVAVLYYELVNASDEVLSNGNLVLGGLSYTDNNANRISWILTQLNLTT